MLVTILNKFLVCVMVCEHNAEGHMFPGADEEVLIEYKNSNINCIVCLVYVVCDESLRMCLRNQYINKVAVLFSKKRKERLICDTVLLGETIKIIFGN